MNSLEEYISAAGALQGFLLFALLTGDERVTRASRILGFACLLMALFFLSPFLKASVDQLVVQVVIVWLFCLQAVTGAVGYLYCRSVLKDTPWQLRDLAHLMPMMLCIGLSAEALFFSPGEMARWLAGQQSDDWRLPATEYVIVAQALGYSLWTLGFVLRHRHKSHANLANFHAGLFRWLITMQVFPLVVSLLTAMPGLFSILPALASIATLMMAVFVYYIAFMQWRKPALFLIEQKEEASSGEPLAEPSKRTLRPDGELDEETRASLFTAIKKQIEDEQIFLDSELTLSGLANATRLNKHHLSEVLNRHAGKNFYEFINTYRVDFVRDRLAKGTSERLLDIALEAGFSSKSTFNSIFKQFTGKTPSQYRKEL